MVCVLVVEGGEQTVVSDEHDRLGFPGRFVAAHARRVRRHSGKSDPHRLRSCPQQSHHGAYRNVALNDITIDGGAGDNLPIQGTAITAVVKQIDWEVNFDGDDARIVGVFYRNFNDVGAKAHLDLLAGASTIAEHDLVHEKANGGLDIITNIAAGDANIYTGNRITAGKVSHDSLYAGTVYLLVGLVAA